ncbi:MAG: hypothetical protein NUV91_08725 [Candidatus Omnitrophica bacterium]|nr:hypothetical protein [Candidatus Omnitrophota bacterium]
METSDSPKMNDRWTLMIRRILFSLIGIFCYFYSTLFFSTFAEIHVSLPFLNFPIFIGEILLGLCFLLVLMRPKSWPLKSIKLNFLFALYLGWLLWKAIDGYMDFGPLSFRNAALFYYPLFALFAYATFDKEWIRRPWLLWSLIILLGINIAQNFIAYPLLAFLVLFIVLCKKTENKFFYAICCLVLVYHVVHYGTLWSGSRSQVVGTVLAVAFLGLYVFLGISRLRFLWKISLLFLVIVGFLAAVYAFGDKNAVKSVIAFKEYQELLSCHLEKIASKQNSFIQEDLKANLYNKNKSSAEINLSKLIKKIRKEVVATTETVSPEKVSENVTVEKSQEDVQVEVQQMPAPVDVEAGSKIIAGKPQEVAELLVVETMDEANVEGAVKEAVKEVKIHDENFEREKAVVVEENIEIAKVQQVSPPAVGETVSEVIVLKAPEVKELPVEVKAESQQDIPMVEPKEEEVVKNSPTQPVIEAVSENVGSEKPRETNKPMDIDRKLDQLVLHIKEDVVKLLKEQGELDNVNQYLLDFKSRLMVIINEQHFEEEAALDHFLEKVRLETVEFLPKSREQGMTKNQPPRSLSISYTNALFRLLIWKDMIEELKEEFQNNGVRAMGGISFGKPQRSKSLEILEWGSIEWKRDGWITPHNSFFHMIYRGGIVGIIMILAIFYCLYYLTREFLAHKSFVGGMLVSVLLYWIALANFLVILELPYNAIPFWSFFGMTFAYAHSLGKERKLQRV